MATSTKSPLRTSISDVVDRFAGVRFPQSITARDAAEYVHPETVAAWLAHEESLTGPGMILSELFDDLTDAEVHELLHNPDTAPALFKRLLTEACAKHVAYEAETQLEVRL